MTGSERLGATYIASMIPMIIEDNELFTKVKFENQQKYLIVEEGSQRNFYVGTFLPDSSRNNRGDFTGTLSLENLATKKVANFDYHNGVYQKKNLVSTPQGKIVCSYVQVCNFVSAASCQQGWTVVATQGMASDQPGRYFCPQPYVSLCQNVGWTLTDSYWKTYCSETTAPSAPPPPPQGGDDTSSGYNPTFIDLTPNAVQLIPCASSFNFIVKNNSQAAVVKGYQFEYLHTNGQAYGVDVGNIEITMPYKTYNGYIIKPELAARIVATAAGIAERQTCYFIANWLRAYPSMPPSDWNRTAFRIDFKDNLRIAINEILSFDFYSGQNVSPARTTLDEAAFTVKDQSKWVSMKFWGRDC
jgi:hypothetical protein